MLTGDLVRVRAKGGLLRPMYVDPRAEAVLARADALFALFAGGAGRKRGWIDDRASELLAAATDKKIGDGFLKLLHDASDYGTGTTLDPADVRWRVFTRAAQRGPLSGAALDGAPSAATILAEVGSELGADPSAVDEALYGDLEEEQVLRSCKAASAEWLVHRYNVALVQACLVHAAEVRIQLTGIATPRMRQLLRAVKFRQLIAVARRIEGGWELAIDGPASLFSGATRYGLSLAKFFPALCLVDCEWRLEAPAVYRRRRQSLVVSSADGLRSHYVDRGAYRTREAEWFAERFRALDSGWELIDDAEPIDQGGEAVVVPDFSFRNGQRVAHLEILGTWRKASIARRLEMLERHGPANLVVAVSKKLCGEKETAELPAAVVPFAEVVPARQVLERIEAIATRPRG